jgi:predicted unusual protein kinase regulating ubiquinone biosynthesis (AarF/ABC1/UbiB family)
MKTLIGLSLHRTGDKSSTKAPKRRMCLWQQKKKVMMNCNIYQFKLADTITSLKGFSAKTALVICMAALNSFALCAVLGRIGLIDFGQVKQISGRARETLAKVMIALEIMKVMKLVVL